jgi:hypothetical protein
MKAIIKFGLLFLKKAIKPQKTCQERNSVTVYILSIYNQVYILGFTSSKIFLKNFWYICSVFIVYTEVARKFISGYATDFLLLLLQNIFIYISKNLVQFNPTNIILIAIT